MISREHLLARAAEAGGPWTLVVFHSTRLPEIRAQRGDAVAGRVLEQLAEAVRERLRPSDLVAVADDRRVAVLFPGPLRPAQETAHRLHRELRESSRFPVSTGLAHSLGLEGGGEALYALACRAAEEAHAQGARNPVSKGAGGDLPPPAPAAPAPVQDGLEARFQRQALLLRVSHELFSEKPFPQALRDACNVLLALTGARHAAVHLRGDLGLEPAIRHGDPEFSQSRARLEEDAAVIRAGAERRMLTTEGDGRGWAAVPLLRVGPQDAAVEGVLVLGYEDALGPDPERDLILLEASRQFRNAGTIRRALARSAVLAAVTEQSADAIFTADLSWNVLHWNPSAERLFLYRRADIQGLKASELLVPEDKLAEQRELETRLLAEGRVSDIDTTRLRKDGEPVPVEGSYTLLRGRDGAPEGIVGVFRDATKRKELERMRSEVAALLTHELRTPLTAIAGFAEALADMGDELGPQKRLEYLRVIREESARLGRLTTDFLDLSRAEAAGPVRAPRRVELGPLVDRAAALLSFRGQAAAASIKADLAVPAAHGDEERIFRLLLNLCANALRYSPPGGTVTVASRPRDGRVEVSVRDRGPGISPELLPRLFGKFARGEDEVSRRSPGTGLGLAICREIVGAHGGRIWAENDPGGGAVFRFTLPAD